MITTVEVHGPSALGFEFLVLWFAVCSLKVSKLRVL